MRSGIFKALKKRGIKEGDTVVIGQMETLWSDDQSDRALFKAWKVHALPPSPYTRPWVLTHYAVTWEAVV
jgi:hypothetical protein